MPRIGHVWRNWERWDEEMRRAIRERAAAVLDEFMLDLMYDIPSSKDIVRVVITQETVAKGTGPEIYSEGDELKQA